MDLSKYDVKNISSSKKKKIIDLIAKQIKENPKGMKKFLQDGGAKFIKELVGGQPPTAGAAAAGSGSSGEGTTWKIYLNKFNKDVESTHMQNPNFYKKGYRYLLTNGANANFTPDGGGTNAAIRELSQKVSGGKVSDGIVSDGNVSGGNERYFFRPAYEIQDSFNEKDENMLGTINNLEVGLPLFCNSKSNNKEYPIDGVFHVRGIKWKNGSIDKDEGGDNLNKKCLSGRSNNFIQNSDENRNFVKCYYKCIILKAIDICNNNNSTQFVLNLAQIPGERFNGDENTYKGMFMALKEIQDRNSDRNSIPNNLILQIDINKNKFNEIISEYNFNNEELLNIPDIHSDVEETKDEPSPTPPTPPPTPPTPSTQALLTPNSFKQPPVAVPPTPPTPSTQALLTPNSFKQPPAPAPAPAPAPEEEPTPNSSSKNSRLCFLRYLLEPTVKNTQPVTTTQTSSSTQSLSLNTAVETVNIPVNIRDISLNILKEVKTETKDQGIQNRINTLINLLNVNTPVNIHNLESQLSLLNQAVNQNKDLNQTQNKNLREKLLEKLKTLKNIISNLFKNKHEVSETKADEPQGASLQAPIPSNVKPVKPGGQQQTEGKGEAKADDQENNTFQMKTSDENSDKLGRSIEIRAGKNPDIVILRLQDKDSYSYWELENKGDKQKLQDNTIKSFRNTPGNNRLYVLLNNDQSVYFKKYTAVRESNMFHLFTSLKTGKKDAEETKANVPEEPVEEQETNVKNESEEFITKNISKYFLTLKRIKESIEKLINNKSITFQDKLNKLSES